MDKVHNISEDNEPLEGWRCIKTVWLVWPRLAWQWHDVCIGFGWKTTQRPIIPVWSGNYWRAPGCHQGLETWLQLTTSSNSFSSSSALICLQLARLTSHLFIQQQLTYKLSQYSQHRELSQHIVMLDMILRLSYHSYYRLCAEQRTLGHKCDWPEHQWDV